MTASNTKGNRVSLWCTSTMACAFVAVGANSGVAQATLPATLRESLLHNAAALDPIHVTWARTRRSNVELPELLAKIGSPTDLVFFEPHEMTYIRQGHKFYVFRTFRWRNPREPVTVNHVEHTFDEENHYNGNGLDAALKGGYIPTLAVIPHDRALERAKEKGFINNEMFSLEYFEEAGFTVPNKKPAIFEPVKSQVIHLLEEGGKLIDVRKERLDESQQRQECVLVEIEKADRKYCFYLDQATNYTVLRRDEYWSGNLAQITRNRDLVKLAKGLWLPQYCHAQWYTWPGKMADAKEFTSKPIIDVDIRAKDFKQTPVPAERFVLKYNAPGTAVLDGRLAGAEQTELGGISYRMPAKPEDLDKVIEGATRRHGITPSSRWLSVEKSFIVGGVLILILALTTVLWRRSAT